MAKTPLTTLQWAIDRDRAYREQQRQEHADKLERQADRERLLVPGARACEETYGMVGDTYLRCGRPAVVLLKYRGRDEGPYAMCFPCADHNLRNRNAGVVEWLDKALEEETKGRYRPL